MGKTLIIKGADFSINALESKPLIRHYDYDADIVAFDSPHGVGTIRVNGFAQTQFENVSTHLDNVDGVEIYLHVNKEVTIEKINVTTGEETPIKTVQIEALQLTHIDFEQRIVLTENEYIGMSAEWHPGDMYLLKSSAGSKCYQPRALKYVNDIVIPIRQYYYSRN